MGKNLKILLVGLGSIGRRHLACLRRVENLQIAALRTSKGTLKDKLDIVEFYSVEEALEFNPDGVIISNPTALHVDSAIPFLKNGAKVLIEKPVAHNIKDAIRLQPYAENIRVAYCMRFLPVTLHLKKVFESEPPFKISFKRSFYLPKWHPYADYREEYTAKKELGGGVIRTLSHELDLSIYWLGKPADIVGVTDKLSFLDIDTDDFAFFTLKTESGARANFELDFFSPVNINTGEAFTAKGKYQWDMNGLFFTKYNDDISSKINIDCSAEALIKMYEEQMVDFILFIAEDKSINATYDDSIKILEIIEKIDGTK